jgi:acyl-CoA thioesterase-1
MRRRCLLLAALPAWAWQKPGNPAYAPIEDDPALPRVLLIGDSISIGYTLPVRALLAGVANVHRPAANCSSTRHGLANLDKWLGAGKWDAIHFNFGLHDCFIEDGKHPVPPAEYERNLHEIVERLRAAAAHLVWATTTPIAGEQLLRPRDRKPVHDFYARDIAEYNAIAGRVMRQEHIPIDDLYAYAAPRLREWQRANDVHFTAEGSQALAREVAASIRRALGR